MISLLEGIDVLALPGVGPTFAAVLVDEIGDAYSVLRAGQIVLVGRADPETPRVGHRRAARHITTPPTYSRCGQSRWGGVPDSVESRRYALG